ncbi:pilus assembly protein TadG-related protein [Tessaracoccus sp. Y36]
MQRVRLTEERGATAIVVGIMLVVLVGFGALAVDVGALWLDKKELQNGADAGALAIAQACAAGEVNCDDNLGTARQYKADNRTVSIDPSVDVEVRLDKAAGRVEVQLFDTREAILSGVLGVKQTTVDATAVARWSGSPSSLTTIPFAVSFCQFRWQNSTSSSFEGLPEAGDPVQIQFKSQWKDFPLEPSDELTCMDNAAHNEAGGGFGYLKTSSSACEVTTSAGSWVNSSPGNNFDGGCTRAEIEKILGAAPGKTVLIPIFDDTNRQNGDKAQFHLSGYAAMEIEAYCVSPSTGGPFAMPTQACGGQGWIKGTFVGFATLGDVAATGPSTSYGVTSVRLALK